MKKFALDRRAVLKGLGGITLGLPLLEAMLDSRAAFAQNAPPLRYLVFFNGQSQGADGDAGPSQMVPSVVGPNWDAKAALDNLKTLTGDISVISGLRIPTSAENAGMVPAAGRSDDFHVTSLSPLLSGVRSPSNTASAGPVSTTRPR